jgi:hypothetical protein
MSGGGSGAGGTAPRDQRNLGEAEGTLRNDLSALNLWAAYRKSRDRPPEINAQELKRQKLSLLIFAGLYQHE